MTALLERMEAQKSMLTGRRWRDLSLVGGFVVAEIAYGAATVALGDRFYLLPLAAVGLIGVVVTFVHPIYGLYAFAASMFMEELLMLGTMSTPRVLGFVVIGAWIMRSLIDRQLHIVLPVQAWLAIVFAAWGLISIMWAASADRIFERMPLLVQSIGLYVLVVNLVDSRKKLYTVVGMMLIGTMVVASSIASRVLTGGLVTGRATVRELSGLDPNFQAFYLLPGTALLIALSAQKTKWATRLWYLAGLLASVLAIMATVSRGGMIALVGVVALSLAMERRVWWLVVPLSLAIGTAILFVLPSGFLDRVQTIVTLSDSGAGRIGIWLAGMQMILAHPIRGIGLGNYSFVFFKYLSQTTGVSGIISAFQTAKGSHNIYINVLSELGVIGFALFGGLLGMSVRRGFKAIEGLRRGFDAHSAALGMGLWIGLIGMLIAGLALDVQYQKVFWLMLALAEVTYRLSMGSAKDGVLS